MDRWAKQSRQSSLPTSLIPHLYSGPQQSDDSDPTALPLPSTPAVRGDPDLHQLPSMRSTLTLPPVISSFPPSSLLNDTPQNYEHRSAAEAEHPSSSSFGPAITRPPDPFHIPSRPPRHGYLSPSPVYHTPQPRRPHEFNPSSLLLRTQDSILPRNSWREGEAGPSSRVYSDRGRRGSSQPAQFRPRMDHTNRGDESEEEYRSIGAYEREREMEDVHPAAYPPIGSYTSWPNDASSESSSSHTSRLLPERPLHYMPRVHSAFPISSNLMSQRTWSGTVSRSTVSLEDSLLTYSPGSVSEISSDAKPDDDYDDDHVVDQKGIKRGRGSDGAEENPTKSRAPRKTAVACNFCRGRKLRCNGVKPSCYNCTVRKFQCEYVPVQRRRGPGKAPKGSKSKKGGSHAGRSEPSTSLPPNDRTSSLMHETLPTEYPLHASGVPVESLPLQTPEVLPRYASPPSQAVGRQHGEDKYPGSRPVSRSEMDPDEETES